MAITVFISLYATRILLASLGANDFGIFAVIGSAVAMLGFLNASMSSASQRFMSYAHGQRDENKQIAIFNTSFLIHISIGAIMALVLELIGLFLFSGFLDIDPDRLEIAKIVYHFVVISTFFTIISVPYDAVITARENMLFFAILSTLESLSKLAIALYVSYTSSDKLAVYGLLMACMMAILFLVRVLYCQSKYSECQFAPRKYYSRPLFIEMLFFGGWSLLGSASTMIASYGQSIAINKFFGTTVNSAQGIALQLNGQVCALGTTMLKALNPMLVKSEGSGAREQMLKASLAGSKFGFYLLCILCVPAIVEMPFILSLWLKNVPQYAVAFCSLLLIRSLVEQLFITLFESIKAVGDIKAFQITLSFVSLCPLVLSCLAFYYSAQPWSLYLIFIIFSLVRMAVALYFCSKKCGLIISDYVSLVILKCLPIAIITFFIDWCITLMFNEGVLRLLFIFLTSNLTLLILVSILGLTHAERINLKSLLSRRLPLIRRKHSQS